MNELVSEIERRLRAVYTRIVAGDDLPPALRLRLEGLLEAAVISGCASAGELQALLDNVHQAVAGESLAERYGADWRERFPFPEFPAWQQRAPVTPSTTD